MCDSRQVSVPRGMLQADWWRLCADLRADLKMHPSAAANDMLELLALVTQPWHARAFLACGGSGGDGEDEKRLVASLAELFSRRQDGEAQSDGERGETPATAPHAFRRCMQRGGGWRAGQRFPRAVALIQPRGDKGHIHSAVGTGVSYSGALAEQPALFRHLSATAYCGGGGHTFFMKTWGAGLAYSSGVSVSAATGVLRYYGVVALLCFFPLRRGS